MNNETSDLILQTLLELKASAGETKAAIVEIKDAHSRRLDDIEDSQRWQWRISAMTIPVTAGLHAIATKLGFRI